MYVSVKSLDRSMCAGLSDGCDGKTVGKSAGFLVDLYASFAKWMHGTAVFCRNEFA